MKQLINSLQLLFIAVMLINCSGNKNNPGSGSNGDSTVTEANYAVCIWDKTPLKETPDEKGKWLASLSLGEKCTYMDDKKEVNIGTKDVTFYKIKLQDGKEGWAQSDLIILNSRPATFIQNADIYSRPDLLTKTPNKFSKMDIVAVKSTQKKKDKK